ncbi:MAG: hypothetical protein LUB61_02395, partial [Eggerthellaceae bacterium]|nr:hypothetical protein [Eggerthellaceae bacterium]
LCDILSGTKTRLLVVGGAGSLYVDPGRKMLVSELPYWPERLVPVIKASSKACAYIKTRDDVEWTYFSPAMFYMQTWPKTGRYTLGREVIALNLSGKNEISYDDYAIAMIDEVENGNHIHEQINATGNNYAEDTLIPSIGPFVERIDSNKPIGK